MGTGHIQLGAVGALRDYMLEDPETGIVEQLVNQMARKVAQGESKHADLLLWDHFTQTDWQAGIGKTDPDEGLLFSNADTRFKNKMFLGGYTRVHSWQDADDGMITYEAPQVVAELPVRNAAGQSYKKVSVANFTSTFTLLLGKVYVYLKNEGIPITVEVYNHSTYDLGSGSPTLLYSGSLTTNTSRPGYEWYAINCSIGSTAWNTTMVVVLYPTSSSHTINVPVGAAQGSGTSLKNTDAGWTFLGYHIYRLFQSDGATIGTLMGTIGGAHDGKDIVRFNGQVYAAFDTQLYKYDGSSDFDAVGTARSTSVTAMEVFGSVLYIGLGNSTNLDTMNTSEVYSAGSVPANLLWQWGGYLYRAVQNDLYYSVDGSSWNGPFEFGPDDYEIRGMCGMDEYLYVSTDEGLYYLAPGDIPVGLVAWDDVDSRNGRGMIDSEGYIYIPLVNQVVQYNPAGTVRNIWIDPGSELPRTRVGEVQRLTATLGMVIAPVSPADASYPPLVMAWNGQGWHVMGTGLPGTVLQGGYHDRTLNKLWLTDDGGNVLSINTPASVLSPLSDSSYWYRADGWVEYDWFDGGVMEARKDYESVYIAGQQITSTATVKVYWKDDDSTAWELLGTCTSNRTELRWSSSTTRPNTRRIKIGLLLNRQTQTDTPIVEVVTVKFHTMETDRWGWSLNILVSGNATQYQEMLNGTVNAYTAAEMRTHLKSMCTSVPPVIFKDMDGTYYEVKVTSANSIKRKVEYFNSALQYQEIWRITLEQVTDSTYTP